MDSISELRFYKKVDMIKLKNLLLEVVKNIIVGIITTDDEVISHKDATEHGDLIYKHRHLMYGKRVKNRWRYNRTNKTVYWWEEWSKLDGELVMDDLQHKYGYEVVKHLLIDVPNDSEYNKRYRDAHGYDAGDVYEIKNNVSKIIAYHGTDKQFKKFDLKYSTQNIIWFTSNKQSIINGDVGANSKGYIITAELTLNNPAGWEEYHKQFIIQLKNSGFDGIILDNTENSDKDYIVFSPDQIKILKVEKI